MPPTNDTLRRGRCPHRPASGHRPPLQYTQHPFILSRRGRPMWRPTVGRDDPARRLKFAFRPSRGPDFRRRTGNISPPGEVLSKDGKYPKILGSSSSQSPLRSERPGVGVPRCAPLLLLSHLNPLALGFKWGPGECYRGRPPHPSSPTAMPPSPLWGEGLTGAFYRLPPSGGKV